MTLQASAASASLPAGPPRENLIRALNETPELERAEADAMPTMTGHFAVFDQWTEIRSIYEGHFLERIAPGAFKKTFDESAARMRVLFNHGKDPQVGDKVLGPVRSISEDGTGARYEVPLLDTSYNRDLIPGLEQGLYGASFRFQVMREDFNAKPKRSDYNPDGIPERTVVEARVSEFGPVTFPAYSGATAGLRSMTDEFVLGRFIDEPEHLRELLLALTQRAQVSEPEPSEATTPAPDSEPEPSEATTHSDRGLFWFVDKPAHIRS